jgi:hypothetical protein
MGIEVKIGRTTVVIKSAEDLEAPITVPRNVEIVGFNGVALSKERYEKVMAIVQAQRSEDKDVSMCL